MNPMKRLFLKKFLFLDLLFR